MVAAIVPAATGATGVIETVRTLAMVIGGDTDTL